MKKLTPEERAAKKATQTTPVFVEMKPAKKKKEATKEEVVVDEIPETVTEDAPQTEETPEVAVEEAKAEKAEETIEL